jgi:hypothetical protein
MEWKGSTLKMHLPGWRHIPERKPEIHEGSEPFRAPRNETRREQIGLSSLAVLGLLCHSLIFWLLSFPYVYRYDPYLAVDVPSSGGIISITTGWDALGAIPLLPAFTYLPVFTYLACLLPALRKSKKLEVSMYLNAGVNLGGFLLFNGLLFFSRIGDANHQTAPLDAAYGIHLTFLFLAALCSSASSIALSFWLRRIRKLD